MQWAQTRQPPNQAESCGRYAHASLRSRGSHDSECPPKCSQPGPVNQSPTG